jgi:hypothetical protein
MVARDPRTEIVERGYDAIAQTYLEWSAQIDFPRAFDAVTASEMFFSSWDADTNRRLLVDTGFELLRDEVLTIQEPEGLALFLWVLARRA